MLSESIPCASERIKARFGNVVPVPYSLYPLSVKYRIVAYSDGRRVTLHFRDLHSSIQAQDVNAFFNEHYPEARWLMTHSLIGGTYALSVPLMALKTN